MTSEEQLAIRETLAKAQGYTIEFQEWTRPHEHENEAGRLVLRRPEWDKHSWIEYSDYDPFANAADLLALLEWAPNQKWFGLVWRIETESLGIGKYLVRITKPNPTNSFYNRQEVTVASGSLQEALPLAIYQALQEVGNASNDA